MAAPGTREVSRKSFGCCCCASMSLWPGREMCGQSYQGAKKSTSVSESRVWRAKSSSVNRSGADVPCTHAMNTENAARRTSARPSIVEWRENVALCELVFLREQSFAREDSSARERSRFRSTRGQREMGEMRRMRAENLVQDLDNGCADASWTCPSPKGARSRLRTATTALHLAVLLAGCTAAVAGTSGGHGITDDRSSIPGSWWRWLRDLATGSRRGVTDWGVSMDAAWKTDVELCSRKQVVDAFFEDSDKDKSGTLSQEEWTTACAELRTNICAKWEEACRAQVDDFCTAEWEKTCLEEDKKKAERLAIEQNVFYEMGSRAVISEPDDDGLISGDGEITLAEFQEPIVPYVSG